MKTEGCSNCNRRTSCSPFMKDSISKAIESEHLIVCPGYTPLKRQTSVKRVRACKVCRIEVMFAYKNERELKAHAKKDFICIDCRHNGCRPSTNTRTQPFIQNYQGGQSD